jgi:hypothetical protein
MPARAFRAWLEPLIPSLRRVRLDTGFPAAVSLPAAWRAWPIPDRVGVAALASWSCFGAVLVPAEGPDAASGARGTAWSWAGPAWSLKDQAEDRAAYLPQSVVRASRKLGQLRGLINDRYLSGEVWYDKERVGAYRGGLAGAGDPQRQVWPARAAGRRLPSGAVR